MSSQDWTAAAEAYVTGIEAEARTDKKKFYNQDGGSKRAKAAIAKLDALRQRLQAFVRA